MLEVEEQQEHRDEIRSSDIKSYLTGYSTTQAEMRWVLNLVCGIHQLTRVNYWV